MSKHKDIYMKAMGFDSSDFIPCEVCKQAAVDIHHIKARGMGGTTKDEHIDNLMALCRNCHNLYGDHTSLRPLLEKIHRGVVNNRNMQRKLQ